MTQNPETPAPPPDRWSLARADYLAGASAPVVAERYGLSERTLRRRAADEGWRRADAPATAYSGPRSRSRAVFAREEVLKEIPELADVEQMAFGERYCLLVRPDQKSLRRFAFEQAAEAAALSRPAEAVVWMRLVQSLERTGDRIDREGPRFTEQDCIRAVNLRHAIAEAEAEAAAEQG